WSMIDGLICWKNWIYIPKERLLQDKVDHLQNDTPLAGYPGCSKTVELILKMYWWPHL
ncbi:hypothetical protein PAXRUDRAFT_89274, partial [Paxillus rubicundulus Ve08.2h10]